MSWISSFHRNRKIKMLRTEDSLQYWIFSLIVHVFVCLWLRPTNIQILDYDSLYFPSMCHSLINACMISTSFEEFLSSSSIFMVGATSQKSCWLPLAPCLALGFQIIDIHGTMVHFYAPASNDQGYIVFVLSVCLSACLFVCLSVCCQLQPLL